MSNLERTPTLTRSHEGDPVAAEPLHQLIPGREVDLGEGTPVRRLLPKRQRTTIGAWWFVDHFGPGARGCACRRIPTSASRP